MSSYIGKHASLYDIFYAQKNYSAEAEFVHKCLQDFSPKPVKNILELAGGTGKHANFLSEYGYQVLVTDYSQDMLDRGEENYGSNKKLSFKHWDMSLPKKFDQQFDAAICLFDAIGYVQTNEKILATLRNVHSNIRDNGIFIFEFWNAGAMLRNYEPHRVKKFSDNGKEITRVSETELNYANQTATVSYTITIEGDNNGTIKESQTNRYFMIREMEQFVEQAGFKSLKYFAGFSNDTNITVDTWHTVAVVQKK